MKCPFRFEQLEVQPSDYTDEKRHDKPNDVVQETNFLARFDDCGSPLEKSQPSEAPDVAVDNKKKRKKKHSVAAKKRSMVNDSRCSSAEQTDPPHVTPEVGPCASVAAINSHALVYGSPAEIFNPLQGAVFRPNPPSLPLHYFPAGDGRFYPAVMPGFGLLGPRPYAVPEPRASVDRMGPLPQTINNDPPEEQMIISGSSTITGLDLSLKL